MRVRALYAKHKDGKLVITRKDNGAGMDAEAMNEELGKADIGRIEMGRSIGIMNVNARVKSVYGNEYGIHYESVAEDGTKAVIVLPIAKEEEEIGEEIQGIVS